MDFLVQINNSGVSWDSGHKPADPPASIEFPIQLTLRGGKLAYYTGREGLPEDQVTHGEFRALIGAIVLNKSLLL